MRNDGFAEDGENCRGCNVETRQNLRDGNRIVTLDDTRLALRMNYLNSHRLCAGESDL